jgi:hypothetical protein
MIRLLVGLLVVFATQAAWSQAWPAKPVKIIVPFAPGGTADTLGRIVAQKLGEHLKASVVVENRAGAGGALGSELVSKAAPDGYTLVVSGIASHVIAPMLPQGTPYDPVKDFTHIALFGGPPAVLAVHPSVEAKDLKEFVALAKSKPGALSYGSPGNGTQGQLVAELFKRRAGIDLQHVPYKGASGAVTDLIAGHIPAVVHDADTVVARAVRMVKDHSVEASDGTALPFTGNAIAVGRIEIGKPHLAFPARLDRSHFDRGDGLEFAVGNLVELLAAGDAALEYLGIIELGPDHVAAGSELDLPIHRHGHRPSPSF